MSAKLISYTMPAPSGDIPSDWNLMEQIAYCARVSNPGNKYNNESSEKLIQYLIRNHHWSPLEMANICLEIQTTRDISRQIIRHRSFVFQEYSQRYAIVNDQFETREARLQDEKNRQNSLETHDDELKKQWLEMQNQVITASKIAYDWAIENGIAKEQARAVLPEGNTPTTLMMNGSCRSWWHYIALRSGNGTQKEHRQIAEECRDAIRPVFPLIDECIS